MPGAAVTVVLEDLLVAVMTGTTGAGAGVDTAGDVAAGVVSSAGLSLVDWVSFVGNILVECQRQFVDETVGGLPARVECREDLDRRKHVVQELHEENGGTRSDAALTGERKRRRDEEHA